MKMNHLLKGLGVLSIACLAVFSAAQGGGRRGMQMFGGPGGANDTFLLRREDVRRDLALTSDQKGQLDKIQEDMMAQFRAGMGGPGGGGGGGRRNGGGGEQPTEEERAKRRAEMEARMKEITDKTNAVLTADQQKRLKEIGIQLAGARAIMRPDVQKELALSDEVKKKIETLNEGLQNANREIMRKMRDQEIEREDAMALMQKNNTALEAELAKLTNDEQKAKIKAMGGKAFQADEQPQFNFARGGGR